MLESLWIKQLLKWQEGFAVEMRFVRMAFLAPDIIEAIFQGRQPRTLTFRWMKRLTELPLSWEKQRQVLGFAS